MENTDLIIGLNFGALIGFFYSSLFMKDNDLSILYASIFLGINLSSIILGTIIQAYKPSRDLPIGIILSFLLPLIITNFKRFD